MWKSGDKECSLVSYGLLTVGQQGAASKHGDVAVVARDCCTAALLYSCPTGRNIGFIQ